MHWPNLLAAACLCGTAFFTYGVARALLGRPVAALALLLWGLQQPFSARAHLFNHNTVLLLCISATAWLTLFALQDGRSPRWWLGVGVAAGLALLAKYQAIVPLAGIVLALALSGELKIPRVRRSLLIAILIALALCIPHVAWLVQHRFSTIDYATQKCGLDALARGASVGGFLGQQLRFAFPALLLVGLLMLLPGEKSCPIDAGRDDLRRRAWLIGLVALPLVATIAVAPLFGIRLQNHWGNQALQFVALWLAWLARPHMLVARPGWLVVTFLAHALFVALAIKSALPSPNDRRTRNDRLFPAQALADAVQRDWQDRTRCPLRIVVGPSFEAGMVSVYNGNGAVVLEDGDFRKSPWISPDDIVRHGAAYLSSDPAHLPAHGAVVIGSLDVSAVAPAPHDRIYWAIVPPETCADNAWSSR